MSPKRSGLSAVSKIGRLLAVGVVGLIAAGAACGKTKPSQSPIDGGGGGADGGGGDAGVSQKLVILHTNDLHSYLMGASPEVDYTPATLNNDSTVGGMARLVSAITAAKSQAGAAGKPVLLLDAGDFMMGTLFELLALSHAPELQFMQSLGYDATTIGNHELDWTADGLAGIVQAAAANGVRVPIIASNMNFSATDPGDDNLKMAWDAGLIKAKLIKNVGTLKVGFFGLLGADAVRATPQAAPLTFDAIATAATRMVAELRGTDKVDLVIALSHSGIDHTGQGEDAVLARNVEGIDIIISGHTHESLTAPTTIQRTSGGKTVIVTAGAYGQFLGELELTVTPAATAGLAANVSVNGYTLLPIDDKIMGNAAAQATIDGYISNNINPKLAPSLSYDKVLGATGVDLSRPAFQESPVGDLVTDAYRALAGAAQPTDQPVIAVEGNGLIRSDLAKGTTGRIWLADLFRIIPLGIGPDKQPGFPLVTFYLNAKDLRSGFELGAASEIVPNDFFLQVSGLKVTYDMARPTFGRVSSLTLATPSGDQTLDLADTATCYKVVTTNYVAGLLGVVDSFTNHALSVVAKDQDCATPVNPTTRYVDADPTMDGVQELKGWQALVKFVSSRPDTNADSIPDLPATYGSAQGRIVKN